MRLPSIQPSALVLHGALLTLSFTLLYYAVVTRSSRCAARLAPPLQLCYPCTSCPECPRPVQSSGVDPYTSLLQTLLPAADIQRNDCPGPPERPNRIDRPLLSAVPALYNTLPYVHLTGEELEYPTCWTTERYLQWKRGALRTFPLTPRTADLLSHVMFSVVTGRVHHRSRADIIMCTYGQQLRYGQLWFHSDADDEQRRLPIAGSIRPSSDDGECDHVCSERKWVSGLNFTLHLGLSSPHTRWFMVADDDTFIAPKHLADITAQYEHTLPYLIGSVHYNLDEELPGRHGLYGGAGFLISRELAARILPYLADCNEFDAYTESDLFLSRCMQELAGATLVDRPEMASEPPRYYIEQPDDCVEFTRPGISKAATFHYVTPWPEFYHLWMLYQAFSD